VVVVGCRLVCGSCGGEDPRGAIDSSRYEDAKCIAEGVKTTAREAANEPTAAPMARRPEGGLLGAVYDAARNPRGTASANTDLEKASGRRPTDARAQTAKAGKCPLGTGRRRALRAGGFSLFPSLAVHARAPADVWCRGTICRHHISDFLMFVFARNP
jgi:hypothetical protein